MLQPIIIEDAISVAATSTNDNVIVSNSSLRRYLRAPFAAVGKLVACISATGLRIDMNYGSKNVVDSSDLRVGNDLQEPYDVINSQWHPSEGDQLVLRAVNTTGGAITLRYRIVLIPLGEPGERVDMSAYPDARVTQRGPVSVAANAVDSQQFSGLRYERAPNDSILRLLATASADGLTKQLFVDMDSIAPPSGIAPLNRVPQDPLDSLIEGVEVEKDRQIEFSISNSTAGPLNIFWRMILSELVRS